jgi:hypothetical protein
MYKMVNYLLFLLIGAGTCGSVSYGQPADTTSSPDTPRNSVPGDAWFISALPSSIRLNPISGKIIEDRPDIYQMRPLGNLLEQNWIYDGRTAQLHGARGEYVSFQIVIGRTTDDTLKDLFVKATPFTMAGHGLKSDPELFLEWSVKVKSISRGYDRSSYGPGWYPDALIPFETLQAAKRTGRLTYPLTLPDFRNQIDGQRYLLVWIDQFIPFERQNAPPGTYRCTVSVEVDGHAKEIPVELEVWDFAVPNENELTGNIQQSSFVRRLDENRELELYQLFKRHRVIPTDPSYQPTYAVSDSGKLSIDWSDFDTRLKKYFTGEAFTSQYGYSGPGYGEPIELFVLPFNCARPGSQGGGWPNVGGEEEEQKPPNRAIYISAIKQVRDHVLSMIKPDKVRLVVFQNGLDESYFPEAWARMVYYGKLFKEYFPEAAYRVDGGYSQEAMEVIHEAIDYWCCHSVGYNMETVEEYRKLGIKDWVYGPILYERRGNGGVGSSTFIDLELTNERVISWASWKYRTLTWCSWGIGSEWAAAWYSPETWKHVIRGEEEGTRFRSYNGNGQVVYAPGVVPSVDVICPSIRLKNMRDGVEEFEYFRLLAKLDGNMDRVDSLVNRIINRPFGKQSLGNLDVWNHNPEDWDRARIEAGKLIEQESTK